MVVTDGRGGLLKRTLESFNQHVTGDITSRVIVDDSCDSLYTDWLRTTYPEFQIVNHIERRGFCGAVQAGWSAIPTDSEYVFHLEDDFLILEDVNLNVWARLLVENPHVVQVALKRQPWSPEEKAAGGIVEMWPNEYDEVDTAQGRITTHRLFFTTNPSLYRRQLTLDGWPGPPNCERAFTDELLEDPSNVFAFWGGKFDPPRVHHIGDERAGGGY